MREISIRTTKGNTIIRKGPLPPADDQRWDVIQPTGDDEYLAVAFGAESETDSALSAGVVVERTDQPPADSSKFDAVVYTGIDYACVTFPFPVAGGETP